MIGAATTGPTPSGCDSLQTRGALTALRGLPRKSDLRHASSPLIRDLFDAGRTQVSEVVNLRERVGSHRLTMVSSEGSSP